MAALGSACRNRPPVIWRTTALRPSGDHPGRHPGGGPVRVAPKASAGPNGRLRVWDLGPTGVVPIAFEVTLSHFAGERWNGGR